MRNTIIIIGMLLGLAGSASAGPVARLRAVDANRRTQVVKSSHRPEPQSFVMQTNDRVVRSFIVFRVVRSAEQQQDRLQIARERDRWALSAGRPATITSQGAYGAAVMGAGVFLVAHAPRPMRALFDG